MKERVEVVLKAIGNVIKREREKKGLTREELAKNTGMTLVELIKLEEGDCENVTEEEINQFMQLIASPSTNPIR